ncbi:hypothetical protein SCLCIDRAFT_1210221 [Scleroderma citrinum Foug A]|uniref:Uncharacterized protein n=1 Tax=Scleroderma citrinum Foug A TaxID=1036808 RepID=A0A0C3E430_9AGAM|nr:hypothetical protein SCLCIDRAFT_1210221 [Scleroderma citrinum Foug A]
MSRGEWAASSVRRRDAHWSPDHTFLKLAMKSVRQTSRYAVEASRSSSSANRIPS